MVDKPMLQQLVPGVYLLTETRPPPDVRVTEGIDSETGELFTVIVLKWPRHPIVGCAVAANDDSERQRREVA